MTFCIVPYVSWVLVLHAVPQAPILHTELTYAPSCFYAHERCQSAADAANAAYQSVNHPESSAECIEQPAGKPAP